MSKRFPPISAKLPHMMHGADYNPDQWLHDPQVLEEDIRLMKLANCNVMSIGMFAWSALESEEGVFTFEWLDQLLDRFAENGLYAWLATPSGARPAWMSEKYPEVLRVAPNRRRNLHGVRHNHCFTSPVYREKTRIINELIAERYAHHPAVVGWHISNEYNGECHCNYCIGAFRAWLKRKYGTLEALNQAWWTAFWSHTYSSWTQIDPPAPHGEYIVHGMNLDWKRFVTDQTVDFYLHEIAPIKAVSKDLPITTNMMYFFDGLDYRKFADVMDVVSWDAYPTWHDNEDNSRVAAYFAFNHDLFRSLKGGQPFALMESTPSATNWQPISKLKRPGMHRLSAMQAVAHGSDTVQYFQWRKSRGASEKFHGAVVDHVGHEHTRVFQDVASVGQTLQQLQDVIGTTVDAKAAIIFDWDNWWAVKDAEGPRNAGIHYEETVMEHYKALWELGISVDIISSEDDFTKYDLIVAPMMYMVTEAAGQSIERYVNNGGTLVTTYWSGIVNETDLVHLGGFPGPLRKTLGIWSEEIDGLYDHDQNGMVLKADNELGLSGTYVSRELCDLIHLEGAVSLAEYTSDFYAGRPALTLHKFGQGEAYYMATKLEEDFLLNFYRQVSDRAGLSRVLDTDLPAGVTAQARTDGTNDYVFIMNFSEQAQRVTLDNRSYVDLESGAEVSGELELPLYGVRMFERAKV